MRLYLLLATALLGGCTTVSAVRDAWNWDPTSAHVFSRAGAPREQPAAVTNRIAELQIRRIEIRASISAESDVWARQRLYQELHAVGLELAPLERRVAATSLR